MLFFADTNIVIYLVQQPPVWGPRATIHVDALIESGNQLVISDLVRMECLVGPLTDGDTETLALYERFFASEAVQVAAITAAVCTRAAMIRGRYRFSAMDALHLAAAIEHGCQRFLTYDLRLQNYSDINIEVLS
jgi:predicted nucleic acid-binding protein